VNELMIVRNSYVKNNLDSGLRFDILYITCCDDSHCFSDAAAVAIMT